MLRINFKPWIYAIAVCVILIYIIIDTYFDGGSLFSNISKTSTICGILFLVYTKWLWKFKWFIKLLPFPYLGGKWNGELKSTYPGCKPISISVTIKHGFFHSYLIMNTEESKSLSNSFVFNIDEDLGIHQIIYTYQNTPSATVRNHSNIHWGSAVLDFDDEGDKLVGNYWTDRGTTGTITLKRKIVQ